VHTQDASYLDAIHGPVKEWNPTDYAYHLTRRARGLPLWFSLVVHGTDAYRDAIESSLTLARDVAALITATPGMTLLREPTLSVVLWQRDGWEAGDYRAWSDRLLHEQIAFVTPTTWQEQIVGRFAFLHPRTTLADVEAVLATLR
jgi:aromatic-L-amino-acid decarboxylase